MAKWTSFVAHEEIKANGVESLQMFMNHDWVEDA